LAGKGTSHQLAKGFLLAVLGGILEVLFRGLLFGLSAKILGTWGALLLTAALFGAGHIANFVAHFGDYGQFESIATSGTQFRSRQHAQHVSLLLRPTSS
jgi:hypothetical protein